jgi:hypothetical protein
VTPTTAPGATSDPLRRKALRDLLQYRGQMLAIVVVMASGVALFLTLRGTRGM